MMQPLKIVALGGGTGLSTFLAGLKNHRKQFNDITVGVAVTDDGGTTAHERKLGYVAPGDARRAFGVLARSVTVRTFEEKISGTDRKRGNRYLTKLVDNHQGNTYAAFEAANRQLRTIGQVIPVTDAVTDLRVVLRSGNTVIGESFIPEIALTDPIVNISLTDETAQASPILIQKILEADLVVIGPGSLYTSVIASLLPVGIREALQQTQAKVIYIANVSTERGETQGYTIADHICQLVRYAGPVIQTCLVNTAIARTDQDETQLKNINNITTNEERVGTVRLVRADLLDQSNPLRHDPEKLVRVILVLMEASYGDRGSQISELAKAAQMDRSTAVAPTVAG